MSIRARGPGRRRNDGVALLAVTLAFACGTPADDRAPIETAQRVRPSDACPNVRVNRVDSAAAVALGIGALMGDAGLVPEFTVSTFYSDSTGYLLRLTPIDPPRSILFGASGIVKVCLDGRATVLTVDQPPTDHRAATRLTP